MTDNDIIVAPATALGGAIGVVRLSGKGAIECCDKVFRGPIRLADAPARTLHYGRIVDGDRVVDDVVAALYRAPHSYTGEDSVEISIHGSQYIASEVIALLLKGGARMATAGEFSARAFAAGKIDLAQAEAVADIIAADSRAAHAMASTQMRGGYSATLQSLRAQLVEITSLLELELDFSEEDVQFADRGRLRSMMEATDAVTVRLAESFRTGNAIREGVAVAIVGAPNVGKSTLLNRLVGDDRAMVSDIAGTTRDTVEESVVIGGVRFRFVDTAGIRTTDDRLERMGIERTMQAVKRAQIVVHMVEPSDNAPEHIADEGQAEILVANKCDLTPERRVEGALYISAKHDEGIGALKEALCGAVDADSVYRGEAVVSNARHFDALVRTHDALVRAMDAMQAGLPPELLSEEIRSAISSLGEITGEITSQDILLSIFSRFCIGK